MRLEDVQAGTWIHHRSLRQANGNEPYRVVVGSVQHKKRTNWYDISIRWGMKCWDHITGSETTVREKLANWHPGDGRKCEHCR